jgi:hypothetical protein
VTRPASLHPSSLLWVPALAALLLFGLVAPDAGRCTEPSSAEMPDTSFEGVYEVTGSTSTGASRTISVEVSAVSAEEILFETEVGGFAFSESGPANWDGPDRITVPLSKRVPLLGSGSGTVILERTADGWVLDATGEGRVLGTEGTAEGEGPRTRDLPPEPPPPEPDPGIDSATIIWIVVVTVLVLTAVGIALVWWMRRAVEGKPDGSESP